MFVFKPVHELSVCIIVDALLHISNQLNFITSHFEFLYTLKNNEKSVVKKWPQRGHFWPRTRRQLCTNPARGHYDPAVRGYMNDHILWLPFDHVWVKYVTTLRGHFG